MRIFQTKIVEKIKTHVLCSIHIFPKIVPIRRFIFIIIIIVIIIISFMQGIYTYVPETNYVPSVGALLLLLFMVLISLVSDLNLLDFYSSTFRIMFAVPNMAVFLVP